MNSSGSLVAPVSYVSHLESAIDGTRFSADELHTTHAGRPLWVRYDLDELRRTASREQFTRRAPNMWRYRELLPVSAGTEIITLGEGMTPVLPCPSLSKRFNLQNLYMKDESQLPTGSFKSRGLAVAITMGKRFGVTRIAIPTAGNAGGAAAAYAARAGMEAFVFMPEDTSVINQSECILHGAKLYLVEGLITDCGRIVREGSERMDWFDLSTLREPYRIEGKKTMGLELAEYFDWKLPDVILYPTGGGTGLIGMWKAFKELLELGWLDSEKLPRMVSVQSDGCCPIVRAFEAGERFAKPFEGANTIASGIRVPVAVGDFMILDAIRESSGTALSVSEKRIPEWQKLGAADGIAICPETAACIGALETLTAQEWIKEDDEVVIFNTGTAQKYPEAFPINVPHISQNDQADINSLLAKHFGST